MRHREALEKAFESYINAYRRDLEIETCVEAAILEYIHLRMTDPDFVSNVVLRVRPSNTAFGSRDINKIIKATIAEVRDVLRA